MPVCGVGRQVGAVDRAEGRGDAAAAGVRRGAARRVAVLAVAGARQVGAAFDQGRAAFDRAPRRPDRRRRARSATTPTAASASSSASQAGQQPLHRGPSMLPQRIGAGPGASVAGCAGTGCAASQCASAFTSCGLQPLRDLRHAVGRLGAARAGAPGAELRVQVVHRQAQQPGHVRAHAGERRAVAGLAGGNVACRIALLRQRLRPGAAWRHRRGGGGGAA